MRVESFLVLLTLIPVALGERHPLFFAFGDWGEKTRTMDQIISQVNRQPRPSFVALLGDSFYPKGVRSVEDKQFKLFDTFSDVSDNFFVALGNHDYGYPESVPAQIAFSSRNSKWVLPSSFYMRKLDLVNGFKMCVFVLDTHVFEPAQLAWLEKSLHSCQERNMYRIILTHYPLLTVGMYTNSLHVFRLAARIVPLIDRYRVHAYISGHEHSMQAFQLRQTHYIVSGATAQMDRGKHMDTSKWIDELKFFNDKNPAIAIFYIDPEDGSKLYYDFVRASDDRVMYSSAIDIVIPSPIVDTKPFPSKPTLEAKRNIAQSTPLPDHPKLADKLKTEVFNEQSTEGTEKGSKTEILDEQSTDGPDKASLHMSMCMGTLLFSVGFLLL